MQMMNTTNQDHFNLAVLVLCRYILQAFLIGRLASWRKCASRLRRYARVQKYGSKRPRRRGSAKSECNMDRSTLKKDNSKTITN